MKIDEIKDTIICGNCLDVMRQMPDNCIDLVVTSPPYDNMRTYRGYVFDFESIAIELFRVIKTGGVVVWVVGDACIDGDESGTSFRQALYFKSVGFKLFDTMIYAKRGFAYPATDKYHQVFEYMFVLSKDKPTTFNPIKDRINIEKRRGGDANRQRDGSIVYGDKGGQPLSYYGKRTNIWEYAIGGGNISDDNLVHSHPAAFPEKLARDHILSWSNKGDLVMDIFSGSGTTCKMACRYERNYIGIDVSPEYCALAEKRIALEKEKLSLFEQMYDKHKL